MITTPTLVDLEGGSCTSLLGHADGVGCYAPVFSPDGRSVAVFTGGMDGVQIQVGLVAVGDTVLADLAGHFSAEGFDALAVIGHDPSMRGPYWSPDSRWIAIASEEGAWFLNAAEAREVTIGSVLQTVAAFRSGSWSPDGRLFAWAGLRSLFVCSPTEGMIGHWDIRAGSVMWLRDGSLYALGSGMDADRATCLWRMPAHAVSTLHSKPK